MGGAAATGRPLQADDIHEDLRRAPVLFFQLLVHMYPQLNFFDLVIELE